MTRIKKPYICTIKLSYNEIGLVCHNHACLRQKGMSYPIHTGMIIHEARFSRIKFGTGYGL